MQLESTNVEGVPIITVAESRIDAAIALPFKEAVMALPLAGADRIILDLRQVDFIDSSGLGAVVALMKHFAPGTRLDLAGLSPLVAKVFRLTRMDQVFVIHDTPGDGLAA